MNQIHYSESRFLYVGRFLEKRPTQPRPVAKKATASKAFGENRTHDLILVRKNLSH